MNTRIFSIMGIVAVLLFTSGHRLFGLGKQAIAYGGYGDYPFDYGSSPYDYCSYADYKSNVIMYGDCFGY
jgi:hypothetical protein